VLECAGQAAISGPLVRVSFQGPGSSDGHFYENTPLTVVAAICGHVGVLARLAHDGADLKLCTRRGLGVFEAARRHPPEVCDRLWTVLHRMDGPPSSPLSAEGRQRTISRSTGSLGGPFADGGSSVSRSKGSDLLENDPLKAAIERGDLSAVKSLLERGAQFEASDIMAAVKSGDLDVLAFVQDGCRARAGNHGEYRKMMKQTAAQIRQNSRARHSLPKLPSMTSNRPLTPVANSPTSADAVAPGSSPTTAASMGLCRPGRHSTPTGSMRQSTSLSSSLRQAGGAVLSPSWSRPR